MTGDEIQLLSIDEFAEKIKSKYPEYQDMDNLELATKIIEKYPEYADQVDLKKKDEGMDLPLADGFSDSQETEVTEEVVTQQTPIDDTQEWKAMYQSAFGIDPDQHGIQEDEALRQLAQEGEMLASEPMQDRYSEAVG